MKEIRKAFHEILNQLAKITAKAGAVIEQTKLKDPNFIDEKEEFKRALETFSYIEKTAVKAGEVTENLKKKIYELLKIDPNEPID